MNRILPLLLLLTVCTVATSLAQVSPAPASAEPVDTSRIVHLIHTDRLMYQKKDSLTELQILAGHDTLRQGTAWFYCDSASFNKNTRLLEAFGNIHINDNDSVHTYSQYLLYNVDTKIAVLKKNVKLTDSKTNLYTQELQYDLNQKIGEYHNNGRIVSKTTVLTSKEAVYYADMKDAYFKQNVVMTDPRYNLKADSLLYNTETEVVTFIAKTKIKDSANRTITTSDGFYDLKNQVASFGKRPVIVDGAVTIRANEIETDDKTGINKLRGNAVYTDTTQGVSVIGNYIESNRNENTFFATQHPLMIIKQDQDSLYVTADTLFSGRMNQLQVHNNQVPLLADTVKGTVVLNVNDSSLKADTSAHLAKLRPLADSAGIARNTLKKPVAPVLKQDSTAGMIDTAVLRSVKIQRPVNNALVRNNTPQQPELLAKDTTSKNDTSRYFMAWHHVRIFSDSLQAVCDSLFYSGTDSIFRLFTDPIVWASNSQVTGDTIYLHTKNKKPELMQVFEHGLAVNKDGDDRYNQIKGNRLFGYFKNGEMDYMRAKGNGESVYYIKDDKDYLVGVNKASSDIIDMRFRNKELYRVVFISAVTGTMFPISQATEQDKLLRNFKWLENRRPKTKFELFGE